MLKEFKKIDAILAKAIKQTKKLKTPVFFQYSVKINNNINTIKRNMFHQDNTIYMNFPNNKQTYICSGIKIKNQNKDYKLKDNYKILSNNSNKDILTFGLNAFDVENKNIFPWGGLQKEYFIVPEILLIINKKSSLNFNLILDSESKIEEIKKYISEHFKELSTKKNIKSQQTVNSIKQETYPSKKEYSKIFNKTKDAINNGIAEKIVLSKIEKHLIKEKINLYRTHKAMENNYKDCFNFIIQLNKNDYFIGSSPELILKLKQNKISTISLAGTSTIKNKLNSLKEINEQEYVTKYLKKTLEKIGNEIKQSKTKKLKLNYAYHLKTKISANIKNNKHILELLKMIHPTPALSGYPKKEAMDFIKQTEPFNRGYYTGAIGLYNLKGEGYFYAGIRSALIKNKEIYIFSGGGITKNSDYLKEWEETNIKSNHIKTIIKLK